MNQPKALPVLETDEEKRRYLLKYELMDWAETLLIAGTVVVFVLLFICQIVVVNGPSMQPTLHNGERLLTWSTFWDLEAGDIVCVNRDGEEPIIKRVIATEGQTVDVDPQQGKVYVDGKELDESYILEPTYTDGNNRSIGFPAEVPEDCIFVMGDNRNNSLDSRFQEVGMVRIDHVFGKVACRIYPFDKFGDVYQES